MADQLKLPEHVTKVSDTYYLNSKSGKYIHASNIEAFCAAYWKYRDRGAVISAKVAQKRNLKAAGRRWNDE